MHHILSCSVSVNDVAGFSRDVDLSPYGLLLAGSTGVVWELDEDLITIKLDTAVKGFGDKLSVMADNCDVLDVLVFSRPRARSIWYPRLRIAVAVLVTIVAWEWFELVWAPAIAHCLPSLNPVFAVFDGLL